MKRVRIGLMAAFVLITIVVGPAFANPIDESVAGYAGRYEYNIQTGQTRFIPSGFDPRLPGDVYNNTNPAATPNFGFSSTDLNSTFGDRVTSTGMGTLNANDVTIFNASTGGATRPLNSVAFNVALFDGATNAPLGSYTSGVVTFTTPLAAGFFTVVSITGLSGLNINLNTTDVLITQQAVNPVFGAGAGTPRLGIASLDPPTIGSSSNLMYINSSTVGAAGYYNIGTAPNFLNANPGYRINIPEPGTMTLLVGGIALLLKRRRS